MPANLVDLEVQLEGRRVIISGRADSGNFTLTLPVDGASTLGASLHSVSVDGAEEKTSRFFVKATLEVSQ